MPKQPVASAAPTVTPAELLAAYDDKSRALIRDDQALILEQIELEAAGESPQPVPPDDDAPEQLARELVNGYAPPPRAASRHGRLHPAADPAACDRDRLDMLGDACRRTDALAVAQVIAERGADWAGHYASGARWRCWHCGTRTVRRMHFAAIKATWSWPGTSWR